MKKQIIGINNFMEKIRSLQYRVSTADTVFYGDLEKLFKKVKYESEHTDKIKKEVKNGRESYSFTLSDYICLYTITKIDQGKNSIPFYEFEETLSRHLWSKASGILPHWEAECFSQNCCFSKELAHIQIKKKIIKICNENVKYGDLEKYHG